MDFAAPEGILSAGPSALAVEGYIEKRVSAHLARGQDVVFTLDTHEREQWQSHPESAAFPIHCVKGERGWQVYGKPSRHVGHANAFAVEKSAYCPAFGLLDDWARRYDTIEIMGLVTHICVLHTAVGLYTAKVNAGSGVRLIVREEGCASFDREAHAFALRHMYDVLSMGG